MQLLELRIDTASMGEKAGFAINDFKSILKYMFLN